MSIFRKTLVALSLTESDVGLLRYAGKIAASGLCEKVRFVHVNSSESARDSTGQVEAARLRMEELVQAHFESPEPVREFDVVLGPTLDRLLESAVQGGHDLIVLGQRKTRSERRSLARRLAMMAPCSVWLVPENSPPKLDAILVPIDYSKPSADAVSVATEIAKARGLAACSAVHVFFDDSTVRYDEHITEVKGNERAAFDGFVANLDLHGIEVEPIFEESTHPPEAILRVARRHETDLIVMATRGRSRAAAILLGSTTSALMATTSIPVLAVKHFGSRMSVIQAALDQRHWTGKSPKTN